MSKDGLTSLYPNFDVNRVRQNLVYISDWEFKDATLVRQLDNGTVASNGDEGLLFVTLVSNKTGEERRGTVCRNDFNTNAARLFCQSMGYDVRDGVWGRRPSYKYVSRYALKCQTLSNVD